MNLLPEHPPPPAACDPQTIDNVCALLVMLNIIINPSAKIGEQISTGRHLGGGSRKRKFNFRETPAAVGLAFTFYEKAIARAFLRRAPDIFGPAAHRGREWKAEV